MTTQHSNPMLRMQEDQMIGMAYTALLKVKLGHFNVRNVREWTVHDLKLLSQFDYKGWAKPNANKGNWEITDTGTERLVELQRKVEQARIRRGSSYGSVSTPTEAAQQKEQQEELTTADAAAILQHYISNLVACCNERSMALPGDMRAVMNSARALTLEELSNQNNQQAGE